jgi:hypothetical protein
MQGGMANPWATHFGGGLPGELPGGDAPGHLKITMCKQPSQGDARLAALAAKFPAGAPMPALGDAAKPPAALEDAKPADASGAVGPAALEDAKPADASGAVASETPKDASKLSALTAKILAARCSMSDERAKALWACMYL